MAIIGIDLGTTNSVAAILRHGRPEVIPNRSGARTTPSVVGLSRRNELLVGQKPKHHRISLADGPVEEVKRLMGSDQRVLFGGLERYPQEISSYVLKSIKEDTENFLGTTVGCAVITIPAYFNEAARRATEEAGELAGLNVGMILDEPTAAALAYGLDRDADQVVFVYDLGGGTFDVSIIEIAGGHFEVLAIDGDVHLGGKDFDRLLRDYVLHVIRERYQTEVTDPLALHKLLVACELTKCDLSRQRDSSVIIPALTEEIDVAVPIKRELLEELIRPQVESTRKPMERALAKADLEPEDIDAVVLVGGSTRIPFVRAIVQEFFDQPLRDDLNPDECVAQGAALYTALLPENVKSQHAAVQLQPRTLDGELMELVVVPRTAHPLGIGTDEGGLHFSVILPANSFYPVSVTRKDYFTAEDNQRGIETWVYEGDNPIAPQNTPLGVLRLELPPNLPAGTPIWVTFALNASRLLEVTVQLPNHPGLKATATLQACGAMPAAARHSVASHSAPAGPSYEILKRQWEVTQNLLASKKAQLADERVLQIQWALDVARDALESGDLALASERVSRLAHINDELRQL